VAGGSFPGGNRQLRPAEKLILTPSRAEVGGVRSTGLP
jgi:hypothetical protein